MDDLQNQIFEKNLLNEPYKIIYKVKNKSNKYHYFIYIFVGNVPQNIKKNLIKIQNLSLTDAFKNLNRVEFNELKDYYGDKWFYYFFNKYHINKFLNSPNTVINEYEKKFNIKLNIRKLNFIHKFYLLSCLSDFFLLQYKNFYLQVCMSTHYDFLTL